MFLFNFASTLASTSYHWIQKQCNQDYDASTWPSKSCKAIFKNVEETKPEKFKRCSIKWLLRSGWNKLVQTVNTAALECNGFNIHKLQKMVIRQDSLLARESFLPILGIPPFHFATHPIVTSEILKPHRDGDLFITDNGPDSIFAYIVEIFDDKSITPDDIIFTCSPQKTSLFKAIINSHIDSIAMEAHRAEIDEAVKKALKIWANKGENVNVSECTHSLVCDAMSRIILGVPDSSGLLSFAMRTFFDYVVARFSKTEFPSKKLSSARKCFWKCVKKPIKNKLCLAGILTGHKNFTEKQIAMFVFSLFFAGIDSTTQSIVYGIHKYAQDVNLQGNLYNEITNLQKGESGCPIYQLAKTSKLLQQFMIESLRMFTPVIGVTRIARQNLELQVSCENKTSIRYIHKGELIAPAQNLAGRCPLLFPNKPNEFLPSRHPFSISLTSLSWFPFGGGKHVCPGWMIYKNLAEIFFAELCHGYRLTTLNDKPEIEQVGSFINKLKEDIFVNISERSK